MFRRIALCSLLIPSLASVGCGGGGKKTVPLYRTTGKLLVGGKPIPAIGLTFNAVGPPAEEGYSPYAITDSEGGFTVSTFAPNDGAPAGEYVVTLRTPPPMMRRGKVFGKVEPDPFAAKYKDAKTSPIKIPIKPGKNDLGTIEVEPAAATDTGKH